MNTFGVNTEPHSSPLLSIITVTWNAKKYVDLCLRSFVDVEEIPHETILVDNASTDGTPELIAQEFKNFRLLRNPQNLGFAKANNIGIRLSSGRYLCLINSDVVLPEGCLTRLVEFMEANPSVGVAGPQMLTPGGSVSRSAMRFPSLRSALARAMAVDHIPFVSRIMSCQLMADFRHDRLMDVDILNGWFWIIRREALEQVGLLDEAFFMYGEDMDWCRRFRNHGWRVVFYPDAQAIHYGAGSSRVAPVRFYIEQKKADFQYWSKHHGRVAQAINRALALAQNLVRLGGFAAIYLTRPARRSEAAAKMRRSWAFLAWLMGSQPSDRAREKTTTEPLATV